MIQTIFVVLGLTYLVDALFDKWNVWGWIVENGVNTKSKFIFELSICRFCLMFHLSWMITILYGAFSSFSCDLIIVPFIVGGLTRLNEKR